MHVFFVTLLNLPTVAQARLQYIFFKSNPSVPVEIISYVIHFSFKPNCFHTLSCAVRIQSRQISWCWMIVNVIAIIP